MRHSCLKLKDSQTQKFFHYSSLNHLNDPDAHIPSQCEGSGFYTERTVAWRKNKQDEFSSNRPCTVVFGQKIPGQSVGCWSDMHHQSSDA